MKKFLLLSFCLSGILVFAQGKFKIAPGKMFPNTKAAFLAVSPDGSFMASEVMNNVQIWNRTAAGYEPGPVLSDFIATGLFTSKISISYDGSFLVVASSDFVLHIFKRTDGAFKKMQTISDHNDAPFIQSFSPDGKYFVSSSKAGEGFLWKITPDEFVKVSELKDMADFAFSPGGGVAYANNRIYTFKNEKFVQLQVLDGMVKDPQIINFSPDGNYLAIFGTPIGDDIIYLLKRLPDGTYKKTGETVYEDKDPQFVEFSADGKFVASYDHHAPSGRKKIFFYEILNDTLAYKTSYGSYTDDMERFMFLNNGTQAVSGSYREVIVYNVEGVKGNKFYKNGGAMNPVVSNEVKKNDEKPKTEVKQTVKTETDNKGTTINIFWINPNPDVMDDKPVVSEKGTIDIQVKIISNKKVGKEDIRIIINGKEMGKSKFNEVGLKESAQEEAFEYTYVNSVPLEETADHINIIEVQALGKKGKKPLKVLYSAGKPNLHILAIGTSLDLQFPKKDAQDFAELFKAQAGPEKDKLFGSVEVRKLIGAEATTNAIKESIERYRYDFKSGTIGPRDVMLVFISSHGFIYQDKFRIQGDDYKDIYKETYSVAFEEITSRLKEVSCKKLIFLDACFSGGAKASVADINNAISELNRQGEGVTTFSSSSNDEYSYEDTKWQNGAFTYSIKEALKDGKADKNANGIITIGELYEYVAATVPKLVSEVKNKAQHPSMPVNDLLKNTAVFVIPK